MKAELEAYKSNLDRDTRLEKERHARNIEALTQRKEQMVQDKKDKLKVRRKSLTSDKLSSSNLINLFVMTGGTLPVHVSIRTVRFLYFNVLYDQPLRLIMIVHCFFV